MNEIYEETLRIARKLVKGGCLLCRREIPKDERYAYVSALSDGSWWHGGLHEECSEIARSMYDDWEHKDLSFDEVFDGAWENGLLEEIDGRWRLKRRGER